MVREIRERRRYAATRKIMRGGDQHLRRLGERYRDVARILERGGDPDGHVESARDEVGVPHVQHQHHLDVRVTRGEFGDQRQQVPRAERRRRADADHAAWCLRRCEDVGLDRLVPVDQRATAVLHDHAGFGDTNLLGRAVQQARAQHRLEPCHVLADRGARHAEVARGRAETPAPGHLQKHPSCSADDPSPPLGFQYGNSDFSGPILAPLHRRRVESPLPCRFGTIAPSPVQGPTNAESLFP